MATDIELEKVVLSLRDFEEELAMMVTQDRINQVEQSLSRSENKSLFKSLLNPRKAKKGK